MLELLVITTKTLEALKRLFLQKKNDLKTETSVSNHERISQEMGFILDEIAELNTFQREYDQCLDNSISMSLKKRGIQFIHNRYSGFDTEYCNYSDDMFNTLVSAQLSVNSKTILKIPVQNL